MIEYDDKKGFSSVYEEIRYEIRDVINLIKYIMGMDIKRSAN